ncbi:MAG: hypothetical protein KGL39_04235 [Patescibacteria group bacterium]|nr:hypothetical protein [Patescibacteria group bacterium]
MPDAIDKLAEAFMLSWCDSAGVCQCGESLDKPDDRGHTSGCMVAARYRGALAERDRLRAALEEIAAISCGIAGHSVSVGCGANLIARRTLAGAIGNETGAEK